MAKKSNSRSARWTDAVGKAKSALEAMTAQLDELESAISDLRSVQEEYEEWKDNLPENLQSSPLGEKLEEVCYLDIEGIIDTVRSAVEDAESTLDEAENIDLPRGFGRD